MSAKNIGTVSVTGLKIYAYHGVSAQERKVGNYFTVDVSIRYDAELAMTRDNLAESISYADICDEVAKTMKNPCMLIERVAWTLAENLKKRFVHKALGGSVTVTKLRPPMSHEVQGASFSLTW